MPPLPVYLDHSATTPLHPEVRDAMLPFLETGFGNPGSVHRFGRAARKAIDDARDRVAALINADPRDVYFTSGGTESNNAAIQGVFAAQRAKRRRIITSAVEHHAVLHAAEYLVEHHQAALTVLPVSAHCVVDPEHLAALLDVEVALVSVMHANNETGAIQPVEAIGCLCRERGIPFHSDTVQTAGKIPLDVGAMAIDLAVVSAHKIYGPKGVGALYIRQDTPFEAQAVGGAQERGRRAGTENVAGIVGLGKACEIALRDMEAEAQRLAALRDRLERAITEAIPDVRVNAADARRLPHISNVCFLGTEGESVLLGLDVEGVAVSTGAACTAGSLDPSHVLLAMGLSHEEAQSAIRFSLGRDTTPEEIDRVLGLLPDLITRLRTSSPLTPRH